MVERKNLGAELVISARNHADSPALWCRGQIFTYAELFGRAAAIAKAISRAVDIDPGDRIAIFSDRTETAYSGILAILLAGAGYVPLNPRFPLLRNREILGDSGARVVICDEKHRGQLGELVKGLGEPELIVLPESADMAPNVALPQQIMSDLADFGLDVEFTAERRDGDLAYLFFTSGSTGKPKGVPITHANVFAYLGGIQSFCQFGPADRVMQIVDLSFDLSVHDMFLTWLAGACLYSVPENSVLLSTRIVQEFEITAWLSVPSTAAWLKQAGQLNPNTLPSMRYSFFCGEALTGAVAESWATAAPNSVIYNIYGPTEATVAFSSYRYHPGQASPPAVVSLGEALPGQEIGLFDDGVRVTGEQGEICLSGSQVTEGYWNAPHLTEDRFFISENRRWYRTGDLGRYRPDDGFHYAGRADHQVKIRGYRVELQEIEHAVRTISGSDLVAVLAWTPEQDGMTMGCVAFALSATLSEADIIARTKEQLPEYMVPRRVFIVDDIPFNVNGKVDYQALKRHPLMSEIA